jgi:hypothetical protein
MKVVTYKCDACETVKKETNHWFGIRLHRDLGTIVIMPFSKIPEDVMEEFEHVCGGECLLKRVDAMAVAL